MKKAGRATTRRAPAYDQQAALEAQSRHRVMDDNTNRRITQFRHGYEFLAVMAVTPFVAPARDGSWCDYQSAEHYYQSRKAHYKRDERWIMAAATPGEARERAAHFELPENWPDIRIGVMRAALRYKFPAHNSLLGRKLLGTDPAELIETGYFGDRYWGMAWDSRIEQWVGMNVLGALLMARRAELRAHCERPDPTRLTTAPTVAIMGGTSAGMREAVKQAADVNAVWVHLDDAQRQYVTNQVSANHSTASDVISTCIQSAMETGISVGANVGVTVQHQTPNGARADRERPRRLTKTVTPIRAESRGRRLRRRELPEAQTPPPALQGHRRHTGIRWRTS